MDGAAKCPPHPELQPTARRQNRTAADRNSCFTDSPAKLQKVWTSMVFSALNFLQNIVSILRFSLQSKTFFIQFILSYEAASRIMLGGSFRVAFQSFHSNVTHINWAIRSHMPGALHISQCRQERSLGPDTTSSPYWNNKQWLETNCCAVRTTEEQSENEQDQINRLSETLLRGANFLRQHVNTCYWLQPTRKRK